MCGCGRPPVTSAISCSVWWPRHSFPHLVWMTRRVRAYGMTRLDMHWLCVYWSCCVRHRVRTWWTMRWAHPRKVVMTMTTPTPSAYVLVCYAVSPVGWRLLGG